ncbi:pectinesterase family protein [Mesobacillus foraminis]|uniref:pectinesterase family protein n=1 Tax=Mesobacillus foraminis TaxID=279826 RepID=UPI00214C83A7|nr:pectinesterase family protein [Mesobacillus foraminis]
MTKFKKNGKKLLISSVSALAVMGGSHAISNSVIASELGGKTNDEKIESVYQEEALQIVQLEEITSGLHLKKLKVMGILSKGENSSVQPTEFPPGNKVKMKQVEWIGNSLIAVTLDRKLESVHANDIAFLQNGELLPVKRASIGTSPEGNTVILYQLTGSLNPYSFSGEQKVEAKIVQTTSSDKNENRMQSGDHRKMKDVTAELAGIQNLLTVSKDGPADYSTVQSAIDAVPENNKEKVEITIEAGIYKELVTIPKNKPFVHLRGEDASNTVITYDNYSGKPKPGGGTYGTTGSASVYVYGDDFTAENLTFENSFDEQSVDVKDKQAVAVYTRGERQAFINSRFIGNQDTLYVREGTQYFYQSYIEGDVDFIFGGGRAVFEDCDIFSLNRGSTTNNGYVTAASTLISEPYGYLFLNSRLLSDAPDQTVYLGRPWHPSGDPNAIGSVVFMNSYLGPHIILQGWTDMSGFSYKDARFYEYQNYGPGAVINEDRRQLTDEEAEQFTIENVLKGWNPKEVKEKDNKSI